MLLLLLFVVVIIIIIIIVIVIVLVVVVVVNNNNKLYTLTLFQDISPEPAQRFFLNLLAETVTGGARAEGILAGELVIEDSDDAHGVIDFTDPSAQILITVNFV